MEAQGGGQEPSKNISFRYQMMSVRHHTYLRKSYKEVVRIIYRREVITAGIASRTPTRATCMR